MKISDVKVGMRLRSTRKRGVTDQRDHFGDEIEVTELATHTFEINERRVPKEYSHAVAVSVVVQAFRYRIPDDQDPGESHWSMPHSREGYEYYAPIGSGGMIDYEPMEWPSVTAEKLEREAMLEMMESDA